MMGFQQIINLNLFTLKGVHILITNLVIFILSITGINNIFQSATHPVNLDLLLTEREFKDICILNTTKY